MSYLPQLNTISKSQIVQEEFRGLNHNSYLDNSEFYDMKNMSSDKYPYAVPRKQRGFYKSDDGEYFGKNINGITTKQGFCFVEGTGFYYRSNEDDSYHYIGTVENSEKQFVSLGAYILIFPDKKFFYSEMYNHFDDDDYLEKHGLKRTAYFGDLEAEFSSEYEVEISLCDVYGNDYEFDFIQSSPPGMNEEDETDETVTVNNGDLWLDTSAVPAKMMQYSETYYGWVELTTTYVKIKFADENNSLVSKFNAGDGVTLSGFPNAAEDLNSATTLYYCDKAETDMSYIVIPGIISPSEICEQDERFTYDEKTNTACYMPTVIKDLTAQTSIKNTAYGEYLYFENTYQTQNEANRVKSQYKNQLCTIGEKIYRISNTVLITATENEQTIYKVGFYLNYPNDQPGKGRFYNEYSKGTVLKPYLVKIKIKREVPDMEYVCELDNRIWGCSSENHEIYACKQGDPFNFYSYQGLSTDSYTLTIGSDGDFTGCTAHLGYVLFFKENVVHKIYGTKPANYQLTTVSMLGVQKESYKSICIINEILFYKSVNGIMVYQGATPECISDELGPRQFYDAVAGICGGKYYVSMRNAQNEWSLFVYDMSLGLWHKEDDTQFKCVYSTLDDLFFIDGKNRFGCILSSGNNFVVTRYQETTDTNGMTITVPVDTKYMLEKENEIEWFIESGDLYDGSIDNKYISRLRILLEIFKDTKINVYIKYDNEKQWKNICSKTYRYSESVKNTFNMPVIPRRCRRMKIKIAGKGDCIIQAIARSTEQGSEL